MAAALIGVYPGMKIFAGGNKWFLVMTNVGQDTLRRAGLLSGQIGQSNASHLAREADAEVKRTHTIYDQYLSYAGLERGAVANKRVIELGPGHHIGVPLLFAADGADRVVGIDKFMPLLTGPEVGVFYSRLRDTLTAEQKARFDRAITLSPEVSLVPERAGYVYKKELPDCAAVLGAGTFDLVVSNAVMEEIYDPAVNFAAQDALLRPGGVMVHRIDLSDYGMFTKHGYHPLEFLTVPEWIYLRMAKGSGQPNRRSIDFYRQTAARLGYQSDIFITRLMGSGVDLPQPKRSLEYGKDYSEHQRKQLEEIRPRLIEPSRKLSDSDLMAGSIVFVGRKPHLSATR
jgi:hypothetical protein